MIKKQYLLILIAILFVVTFNGIIFAYLTDGKSISPIVPVGEVDIELDVYYVKDNVTYRKEELLEEELLLYSRVDEINGKGYLYFLYLNISEPSHIQYINNLRIDFKVNSTVESYFRVKFYESIVFTYKRGDVTYESSKTETKFIKFNYNSIFFDNRIKDDYFYYENTVKASYDQGDLTPETISFIGNYISDDIGFYDEKYSLKLGIMFEAVQATNGPLKNWGMELTPWGEEW